MVKRTVLLVDNDPVFLEITQEYLECHGYDVISVDNATDARRLLLENLIDVAVVDIRLIDDTDIRDRAGLHLVRDTMWGQYVPKIMLTRYQSVDYALASLRPLHHGQAPAVNFVMKDEGLEVLKTAIEETLIINLAKLRRLLNQSFNESELRDLCLECRIDYENLTGIAKKDKVRELVSYYERRSRIPELLKICRQHRPRAPW